MKKLVDRYKADFHDQPYYGKVKALSLINLNNAETLSTSLDVAFNYSRNHPEYADLHKVLAEVIAVLIEEDIQYVGSQTDIPKNDQDLLEIGKRKISRALEWDNHPAEYLVMKARIESLNGEHDAAKASIARAVSELSRSRTRYRDLRAEFGRIENSIETRRQQSELEARTAEISDVITTVENKLESSEENIGKLNSEIDTIRQNFQRTFLEFLGFFSAIIAVIVITSQIAIEINDPQEAGRLLIVSYGGLLFAFGAFAAMLSSTLLESIVRIILALIGLLTAGFALYVL